MLDDLAKGLGGGGPCLPVLRAEIWDNSGQDIEELIGLALLPLSELIGGGLPDKLSAACVKDTAGR